MSKDTEINYWYRHGKGDEWDTLSFFGTPKNGLANIWTLTMPKLISPDEMGIPTSNKRKLQMTDNKSKEETFDHLPAEEHVYAVDISKTSGGASTTLVIDTVAQMARELDAVSVKQEVTAELEAVKEKVRVDVVNTDAKEKPLLVQMLIDHIAEDGKENPDLLYFLPYLEEQKKWVLGRPDYEDAHARVLCHFWQLTIADEDSASSLALRAKIDIDVVGNYNNEAFVQWWEENIRPWAIKHGAMFNPDTIAADAQRLLEAALDATSDKTETDPTAIVNDGVAADDAAQADHKD